MLQERATLAKSRAFIESPVEYDRELWAGLVEMGLTGLAIPEEFGGAGYGYQELCVIQEELGRVLAVVPYLSSICLGAPLLLALGTEEQKATWLPKVAAGERIVTVGTEGLLGSPAGALVASTIKGQARVNGRLEYVVDASTSDGLVVTVTAVDSTAATYLIPTAQKGVNVEPIPALDGTRKLANVTFTDATGEQLAGGGEPTRLPWLRALVCLSAEMLGGLEACLAMATEYAKVRHQFGRPIGSFQAIKHKCADILVAAQSARSLVEYAAWAADASPLDLEVAASAAKAFCGDAYFRGASENIQIHGGIGFTWEHDAHLFFKRARASQVLLGSSRFHRSVIADHAGL
jgi:acyl-CoA dehydrogenase